MNKTPIAVAGVATLALASVTALTFTSTEAATGAKAPKQRPATAAKAEGSISCNGGASKGLQTRLEPDPHSFVGTSNVVVPVPGASVTVSGPSKKKDTFLVTFSAETYYTGTGWMTLEVHLDGVPIAPFANNGSPLAFASDAKYASHSAQFCTKIGKGQHKLEVKAGTTGGAAESGWLDDWTMSVQRFE